MPIQDLVKFHFNHFELMKLDTIYYYAYIHMCKYVPDRTCVCLDISKSNIPLTIPCHSQEEADWFFENLSVHMTRYDQLITLMSRNI